VIVVDGQFLDFAEAGGVPSAGVDRAIRDYPKRAMVVGFAVNFLPGDGDFFRPLNTGES
jgi:hypothetical protein